MRPCGAFRFGPMFAPRSSSVMFGNESRPGNAKPGTSVVVVERRNATRVSLIRLVVKLCRIVAEKSRCLLGAVVKKAGRSAALSTAALFVIVKRKRYCVAVLWL